MLTFPADMQTDFSVHANGGHWGFLGFSLAVIRNDRVIRWLEDIINLSSSQHSFVREGDRIGRPLRILPALKYYVYKICFCIGNFHLKV